MKKVLQFIMVTGGVLCMADMPNLASKDPGFENISRNWYLMRGSEAASIRDGEGVNQSKALVIETSPGSAVKRAGLYRIGFIPVTEGKTYTLEVKFKSNIKSGYASLKAHMWKGCNGENQGKNSSRMNCFESERINGSTNGVWADLFCTFTIPKEANGVHLELSANDMEGKIVFDDIKMTEGDGAIMLPLLDTVPPLNGKLNSTLEKNSIKCVDFMTYPLHENKLAEEQTIAYMAMTNDTIFVTALLFHDPTKMLKGEKRSRDGSVWQDDGIEFFITHTNAAKPYYHFIINCRGSIYDAIESNAVWNSDIKTATGSYGTNASVIQFALPLKNIGYNHELDGHIPELDWRINIARCHAADGKKPIAYSTWSKVRTFPDSSNYTSVKGLKNGIAITISNRFRNGGTVSTKASGQRFWPVETPMYEELISDTPNPLNGESAFIWPRPLETQNNISFALQYGMEYTFEKMLEEYEKNRLHPYMTDGFDPLVSWVKRTGIGMTLYSPYYIDKSSFPYNPESYKKVLTQIEFLLKKYDGLFWGVSIGDEVLSVTMGELIKRANDPEEVAADPYLRSAIETIRSDYGYGKYSVPSSRDSGAEPFHWLATRNWMLGRIKEMQKDIQTLCAKYRGPNGKKIMVVSSDHCDWALLQHQSRMAPYFDITSAQTVPLNDPARQTLAFRSKLLKDLTGKAVWLCAHVEPYSGNYTEEETAAFLSEVARGGGTGLQIWNYDYIGEQRKMGCSQFDYYGHRARWDTIMDCVKRFRDMNLLKFPKPDFAIYVSNDTSMSRVMMTIFNYEAMFNLVGPAAGTWFKFVSDIQLIDGKASLEDWPFVIIPKADVQDKKLHAIFKKYLENGGTLLCFDPELFSKAPDGSDSSTARIELFGVKNIHIASVNTMILQDDKLFAGMARRSLPVIGAKYALEPFASTEVIGKYSNGTPAVTVKHYLKGGRAVMFAFEIQQYHVTQKAWRDFMSGLLKNSGAKISHPIWNFTFPHKKEKEPVFNLKCLTNNNFYWWNNEVRNIANINLPAASYTFSLAPDSPKYSQYAKIPFNKGNLTNRLLAPSAGDLANMWMNRDRIKSGELNLGLFADTWDKTDPIEIRFSFGQTVSVSRVKIFYHGELPDLKVGFDNGKVFFTKGGTTSGVLAKELDFEEQKTSSLMLLIGKRSDGKKLVLSEVEIWGENR